MFLSKYKATYLLAAVILLAVLSYPFREEFWLGLVHHGMLAAMIGGLADWYAVTAFFRKPLGIGWRTQIIVRNRKRIFREVESFVSEDLLHPAHIKAAIEKVSAAAMLTAYLEQSDGKAKIDAVLCHWAKAFIEGLRVDELAALCRSLIKKTGLDEAVYHCMEDSFPEIIENGQAEFIAEILLRRCEHILHDAEFVSHLEYLIESMKEQYADSEPHRRFLVDLFNVSTQKLAQMVTKECKQAVRRLEDPFHPLRIQFREQLASLAQHGISSLRKESQGSCAMRGIDSLTAAIETLIKDWLEGYLPTLMVKIPEWTRYQADRLSRDQEWAATVDGNLKKWALDWIEKNHHWIGNMIMERLERFTDQELVGFMEGKIGDDLQMIRINGSVIGAASGMFLYLFSAWIQS